MGYPPRGSSRQFSLELETSQRDQGASTEASACVSMGSPPAVALQLSLELERSQREGIRLRPASTWGSPPAVALANFHWSLKGLKGSGYPASACISMG